MHSSPHYRGHELHFGFKQKSERSITLIIRGLLYLNDFNFFLNNNSGTLFEGFLKSNNFEKLATLYYKFAYPE